VLDIGTFSRPPSRIAFATALDVTVTSLFPFSAASTSVLANIPNVTRAVIFPSINDLLNSPSTPRASAELAFAAAYATSSIESTSTIFASTSITCAIALANLATFKLKSLSSSLTSYPYNVYLASTRYAYPFMRYINSSSLKSTKIS